MVQGVLVDSEEEVERIKQREKDDEDSSASSARSLWNHGTEVATREPTTSPFD